MRLLALLRAPRVSPASHERWGEFLIGLRSTLRPLVNRAMSFLARERSTIWVRCALGTVGLAALCHADEATRAVWHKPLS